MINWILHKLFNRISNAYNYDTTYLHEVTDISTTAALRYFGLPMLSQMKGPNLELWAGSSLGSVLDGDCGPCAQLVIDSAVHAGVSTRNLRACLEGDFDSAGDVGLGFRFAIAAIEDSPELEDLRQEVLEAFGKEAMVSASYAAATSRAYPVLKRGMGHGHLCQKLELNGQPINVRGGLSTGKI